MAEVLFLDQTADLANKILPIQPRIVCKCCWYEEAYWKNIIKKTWKIDNLIPHDHCAVFSSQQIFEQK